MNILKMTVQELKALAYDEGVKFEQARQNLRIINQRIMELQNSKKGGLHEETTNKDTETSVPHGKSSTRKRVRVNRLGKGSQKSVKKGNLV